MLLSAFGDDSEDETKQRVFSLACVVAPESIWEDLEEAWIDRNKGIPFHATDCESNQGDYRNFPNCENKCLYKDLIGLLARSGACGWGAVVDLAGHREFFPGVPADMSYQFCLTRVVSFFAEFAHNRAATRIKISLDNRLDIKFNAAKVYAIMYNDPSFAHVDKLADEISFLCSRKNPRIQIADLYARECMKHLDNMVGPTKRAERKSMAALKETERFGGDYFTREYFADKRRKFADLEKAAGVTFQAYGSWLKKRSVQDNISNRFDFLANFDQT